MSSSTTKGPPYDGPPPPAEGQVFVDVAGGYWRVRRVTVAESAVGFYLLHLTDGRTLDALVDSMVVGHREFAALARDRDLKPYDART